MKTSIKFKLMMIVVLFVMIACSSTDDSVPPPIDEPTLQEQLQAIIDSKIGGDAKLKGVSVSIRIGNNELYNLVGGVSEEGIPITSNMRFGIASITKTAVAATILKLEEEGLLSLDDTIGDHLIIDNPNVDNSITIFQLLNHLTGLKGYFQHPDIWPTVENNLDTAIPHDDLVDFIGDPLFDPGAQYSYSNSNYLILGLIIRAASGVEVGAAMRTRFWNSLNLSSTYFGSDETVVGPIASPWRDNDGNGTLENLAPDFRAAYHSVFYTAADIFTTAADLSQWSQHLYKGNALSETSKSKMLDFLDIDSGDPYWSGYGLGVRRFHFFGREIWGHTGGMRGYGTFMLYEPISDLSIVLLNNQSRSQNGPQYRFQIINEMLQLLFDEL
jgi:D-alanyl-D-alanine carboxypeptidase